MGTEDTDTSPLILGNLAAMAAAAGGDVDAAMYWDAGHGANNDPAAFIAWVAKETGYSALGNRSLGQTGRIVRSYSGEEDRQ